MVVLPWLFLGASASPAPQGSPPPPSAPPPSGSIYAFVFSGVRGGSGGITAELQLAEIKLYGVD